VTSAASNSADGAVPRTSDLRRRIGERRRAVGKGVEEVADAAGVDGGYLRDVQETGRLVVQGAAPRHSA